jgi:hypothetical protein
VALGRESVGVELGKEVLGRKSRSHLLFDAGDANVPDVTVLHAHFLTYAFGTLRSQSFQNNFNAAILHFRLV